MSIPGGRRLETVMTVVFILSVGLSLYSLWNYKGFTHGSAGYAYADPLAVYAALFFGLSAAALYRIPRIKTQAPSDMAAGRPKLLWTLLGTGLFLRIAAAPWIPGYTFDLNLFKSWAVSAADNLSGFYVTGSSDYPPLYIYMLYAVGKLAAAPALSPYFTLLIKLPSMMADVATAYLLYLVARKSVSTTISMMIAVFYTFNPAIFINSTFWGQVDSFFTLIIAAAILLLAQNKHGRSTALLTAAVLMKPQGIIYLPVLMFELLRVNRLKIWFISAASAIATVLVVAIPFALRQEPLWLYKLYSGTVNEYPYASVNAFNFFGLLRANYKQDAATLFLFSYHTWGMALIVITTLFSWWMYRRGRSSLYASAAALLQIAGVFTFSSSMHERYLFPAVALTLIVYIHFRDNRLLWLAAGFSLTVFINTYAVLYNTSHSGVRYDLTFILTSSLNILLCGFLAKIIWDLSKKKTAV
jgi:Gpi18-like mannosyltransferase